jgi:hypothetical protein
VKDLYSYNYKLLNKDISKDIRRQKDSPCSWINIINIVKMVILPKAIYVSNAIPVKLPMALFTKTVKSILRSTWKPKSPQIGKSLLSKNTNAGGITIPNFKLSYRAIVLKTAWYWHKIDMKTKGIK